MGRNTLLIISLATLHTLCHGSPLGIGNLDLKLRTPEGRNFNPVQFAEEWVESVSLPVIPVSPVVRNVQYVPFAKAVPVPYRSTPVLVQRESIQAPVVAQYVQPAAIIPQPILKTAPLVVNSVPRVVKATAKSGPLIIEPQRVLVEPVLKPVPVNVKLTPIVIKPDGDIQVRKYSSAPGIGFKVAVSDLPADTPEVVIEPASIVYEHIQETAPLVDTGVEKFSLVISPTVQAGPAVVSPYVAPHVKTAPVIDESIAPALAPKIVETEPSVTPYVNIISPRAPIIKNIPTKGSIPILRPIPVVTGNSIQIEEPKAEIIIVESPVSIVPAALPVLRAIPEVIVSPVANALPEVFELPVVRATPEVILAVGLEPLDAPNPPLPTGDVPFRGGQFHAQDEQGQYAFGHYGGSSTRVETKDSLGRVSGSFAYVNPDGDIQVRKYSSAPGVGFKVAASDLPADTPEVAEVKKAHAKLIADTRASNL